MSILDQRLTLRRRRVKGVALLVNILVLGACSGSSTEPSVTDRSSSGEPTVTGDASTAADHDDQLTLALSTDVEREVPLGDPVEVTLEIENPGERSAAAPVDISLIAPDGTTVGVYRSSIFVPFGESATESVDVTTSRWFADTGEYRVLAEITDPALASSPATAALVVGEPTRTIPRFEDVTEQAGLVTDIPVPGCGQFSNGAGWSDVDGDGALDLVLTRLGDPVQLFVNQGDGTFVDESAARGVTLGGANGVGIADYDNDGDPDLMLVGDGPDALLRNDGRGVFEDVTAEAGVSGDPANRGMSATWGDFDGDSLLDLYVTNYMECTGPWDTESDVISNVGYHPDVLYRNEGDGTFTDVTSWLPESNTDAAGFTAAWIDVNNDGRLDLYVANDFVGISPDHNRLWINGGPTPDGVGWAFTDTSIESGAGLYMNTMGIGVGDVDRDGVLDLALSNIGGNKLMRGLGPGTFLERLSSGIERPMQGIDYPTVTWASAFYDFDLDGWEDLFMSAGNLQQGPETPVGPQPNMLMLNDGTGEHFLDVSAVTGVDDVDESKGTAFADYDGDGLVDMFVVNQAGQPRLYRNVTPVDDRQWLVLELNGTSSNRDGCGARIAVTVGTDTIHRTALCGSGGSGSTNDARVHIGLGAAAATIDSIEIDWPSGVHQRLDGVTARQVLAVTEPSE